MKFKVGDKVITTGDSNDEILFPIGTVGTVVQVDEEDDLYPYRIEDDSYRQYWYRENCLDYFSERSEKTEMPKQKDLYDFDNMTDDDLDRLINEANEVLMSRKKDRMFKYLDDAINAMKEFLRFDGNCAMTSEGNCAIDIINELDELKAYYN